MVLARSLKGLAPRGSACDGHKALDVPRIGRSVGFLAVGLNFLDELLSDRDVSESGIGDSVIRVIWQMWGDLASKIPSNNSNHQVQRGLIDSKIRVIWNIWDDSD